MDSAIAMSLGGTSVQANDPRLKTAGYWEFGLRCPGCSEPVYWKSGWSVDSHFAHFPGTPTSQVCSYRVDRSSSSYSYGQSYSLKECSILLKDVHGQLLELLLDHNESFVLTNLEITPRDEIKPDEIEQNILNLLIYNRGQNVALFDKLFEEHLQSKAAEDYVWFFLPRTMEQDKVMRSASYAIGKEILDFVTASGNRSILYAMVRFYKEQEGRKSNAIIQKVRKQVIESIATKHWYVILKYPYMRKQA